MFAVHLNICNFCPFINMSLHANISLLQYEYMDTPCTLHCLTRMRSVNKGDNQEFPIPVTLLSMH